MGVGVSSLAVKLLSSQRSLIGLPGCENWELEWSRKLAGKDAMRGFDNDPAGLTATQRILPMLLGMGATTSVYQHRGFYRDLNDELNDKRRWPTPKPARRFIRRASSWVAHVQGGDHQMGCIAVAGGARVVGLRNSPGCGGVGLGWRSLHACTQWH
jgi:hypothetical protein